ncbi:polysaccharide biosynthesis protein [Shimia sp. R9_3]|nr:polysaccharide biosynthesis protein [Shimia sp. R9_3]
MLGSIGHAELIAETIAAHKIDVVFHAAAYKHVGLVQDNAFEGVRNNVIGTRIVAEEALRAGVKRFILVSTDKAVRPTSIMGSSKRLAELVIQDLATRSQTTKFSMVRFGNVLGSSGSVILLFQQQIRELGPVTVTHPNVTRFFMTIDEAVRLVLLAGTFSRGGDVFVLDMGTPVSIYEMARKMIEAAGHTVRDEMDPNGDIPIVFTGLKDGEKMHEELLIGSDMLTTPHPKILRAQENLMSELEVALALQDLRRAIDERDHTLLAATLTRCIAADQTQTEVATTSHEANAPTLTLVGE